MPTMEEIVEASLMRLSGKFPETVERVRQERYFITTVRDENHKEYLMVDFTKKLDYFDEQGYMDYSHRLLIGFTTHDKWYNA